MKNTHSPSLATLKRQHRRALAALRKASTDFSPDADRRFLELKKKAEALRLQLYFADQRS